MAGRFWAQQKMDRLALFELEDEEAHRQILTLGRKYTIVSSNTSLIVLDLLEQVRALLLYTFSPFISSSVQ